MGYAVHHRDASGAAQLEDVDSLDKALERVEQLRNEDGATEVRVFREVPIEVKTVYKVVAVEADDAAESGANPAATQASASSTEPPPGAMPLSSPPLTARPSAAAVADAAGTGADGDHADEPELAADSGSRRSSLFSRG